DDLVEHAEVVRVLARPGHVRLPRRQEMKLRRFECEARRGDEDAERAEEKPEAERDARMSTAQEDHATEHLTGEGRHRGAAATRNGAWPVESPGERVRRPPSTGACRRPPTPIPARGGPLRTPSRRWPAVR